MEAEQAILKGQLSTAEMLLDAAKKASFAPQQHNHESAGERGKAVQPRGHAADQPLSAASTAATTTAASTPERPGNKQGEQRSGKAHVHGKPEPKPASSSPSRDSEGMRSPGAASGRLSPTRPTAAAAATSPAAQRRKALDKEWTQKLSPARQGRGLVRKACAICQGRRVRKACAICKGKRVRVGAALSFMGILSLCLCLLFDFGLVSCGCAFAGSHRSVHRASSVPTSSILSPRCSR